MTDKDIVADILERVERALRTHLRNDMGFEQAIVDAIVAPVQQQEQPVRRHWGRSEAYVAARPASFDAAKAAAKAEALRTGRPREAASRHGISRATMYRLISKK